MVVQPNLFLYSKLMENKLKTMHVPHHHVRLAYNLKSCIPFCIVRYLRSLEMSGDVHPSKCCYQLCIHLGVVPTSQDSLGRSYCRRSRPQQIYSFCFSQNLSKIYSSDVHIHTDRQRQTFSHTNIIQIKKNNKWKNVET